MKRLILIIVGITALNLIGVVGVRSFRIATGTAGAFSDDLRQNSKMAGGVWCWLDICPGYTSLADARSLLVQASHKLVKVYTNELQVEAENGIYTFVTNPRGKAGFVDTIVIEPSQQSMTLAEGVLQFGTPISVQEEAEIGNSWHRAICLQSGVCVMVHGFGPRVEMQSAIVAISYHSSNAQAFSYGYRSWNGFTLLPPD